MYSVRGHDGFLARVESPLCRVGSGRGTPEQLVTQRVGPPHLVCSMGQLGADARSVCAPLGTPKCRP
jgi:hypothetical protein